MAIINLQLSTQNLTPVGGVFTFTSNFYDTSTGLLTNDPRYPQAQVYNVDQVSNIIIIPVEIQDGNYLVQDKTVKVSFKNKVASFVLPSTQVNCLIDCASLPIASVNVLNTTSLTVQLSGTSVNSYNWKIINTSGGIVGTGTSNVTNNSFNITTPILINGNYLLELSGTTCKGKSIKGFSVNTTLPNCTAGPLLEAIISSSSTQLKFQFNGISVFGIAWRVKQGSTVLRNGVVKHTSIAQPGDATFSNSTPTIEYAALSPGTYSFEIEGSTCSGPSVITPISFTVSNTPTLAFISGSPSVTGSSGNYTMDIKINTSGAYNTVILNTTTGVYYQNGNITYIASQSYIKTGLPVGVYLIKVGTLEKTITIQNTGGGACTFGPNLSSVLSSSSTGLQFLFDAVNVTAITWRIKQNGSTVRNGVVFPSTNNPFITFAELPEGNYLLEIEGNNCTSDTSSSPFEIVNIPQGNNAGVLVTNVGNKYIGIINARFLRAVANPTTGAIRLFYDEFSQADGSSKQVKGWLLNGQLCEIKASEITALKSVNGLVLPDGNYHFYLYYAATDIATTFEQIGPNRWPLFLDPNNWPKNSKTLEELIIEVKTNI